MEINKRTYPYPVLAEFNDDYQGVVFEPSFKVSGNKTFYKIQMECSVSSKLLKSLLEEKKAVYAIHVECASTRYRALFKSFEDIFEVDIPVGDIDKKVQLSRLIIAAEEIHDFHGEEFHPDFREVMFSLVPGDVLAVAPHVDFYADKKDDELARLPSIFTIIRNENDDAKTIDIDISSQKIQIIISPVTYDKFKYLNTDPKLRSVLAAIFIIPSLTYTLEQVSEEQDHSQFIDLRWYRVLSRRLKDFSIDINNINDCGDSSIAIANSLIGDPLIESLNDLEDMLSQED